LKTQHRCDEINERINFFGKEQQKKNQTRETRARSALDNAAGAERNKIELSKAKETANAVEQK
jgi:hypothetical protein